MNSACSRLYGMRGKRKGVSLPCPCQLVTDYGDSSPTLQSSGPFTHTPSKRDNSTVLPWRGASNALLSAAFGERQGQFSLVLQRVRGGPTLWSPILTALGSKRSHGPPWLEQGHRPRPGPWQQSRTPTLHGH